MSTFSPTPENIDERRFDGHMELAEGNFGHGDPIYHMLRHVAHGLVDIVAELEHLTHAVKGLK